MSIILRLRKKSWLEAGSLAAEVLATGLRFEQWGASHALVCLLGEKVFFSPNTPF
jgi:hypothetical protein